MAKGIPFLENEDLWAWAIAMRRLQAPMIFNLQDWGLVRERLPETVIGQGSGIVDCGVDRVRTP
jgi:hypothetical protein